MENDRERNDTGRNTDGTDHSPNPSPGHTDGGRTGEERPDGGRPATAQGVNERHCHSCGEKISEVAEICPECGVRQEIEDSSGKSSSNASGVDESTAGEPSGRYLSAIVGSIVSFFLGWIPLIGPAIGGVIAGYLRGSDTKESAISGLIGNVIASIPAMGLVAIFLLFGGLGAVSTGDSEAALGLFLWLGIFVVGFAYFFILGAAGGAIGAAMTSRRAP